MFSLSQCNVMILHKPIQCDNLCYTCVNSQIKCWKSWDKCCNHAVNWNNFLSTNAINYNIFWGERYFSKFLGVPWCSGRGSLLQAGLPSTTEISAKSKLENSMIPSDQRASIGCVGLKLLSCVLNWVKDSEWTEWSAYGSLLMVWWDICGRR